MKFQGRGVAAIVGPNGCGKSNLSDAINWVLGEQSAKSLRGARMEDVIFAGTRDRKPLGMAQVTLTLVDPEYIAENPVVDPQISKVPEGDAASHGNGANGTNGNGHHENGNGNGHHAPEPPSIPVAKAREITITRRLFRNGESEYLINGRTARLRDIQDIFMGTGLGPESYAIIEQGRIGQILSTKPGDRRAIVEEAAGVSKFKNRRRLAEAKLEGAKQNLNRVFDILEEVGRQAGSLKRQAAKAKRYEELRTEYVGQLRLSLAGRFQALERDAAKAALDLNLATAELQKLSAEVAEGETAQKALREQCYATEAELTTSRARLSELNVEAERTRGRLENQARQIGDIESRLAQNETERRDVETRCTERAAEVAANTAGAVAIGEQVESERSKLIAQTARRDELQSALRDREKEIEFASQRILTLLNGASALRNQLGQIDGFLASIERDSARLKRDEEVSAADVQRLEEARAKISEQSASRQLALESTASQRKNVEGDLQIRKSEAGEMRATLDRLRTDMSRLKARKDSLEEILSHRAYTTESVKRLFTAIERGQAGALKPMGVLADFVEVDSQYEKATEEFLHEELEYVLVENWDAAQSGIELMRSDLDGRATFLVHPTPDSELHRGAVAEPPIGPETGIAARLSDVLRLTNGLTKAPAELLPRLSRCFLATDRAAAQRLALEYPDVYFLLPDGVCYHGYAVAGGKKTGSGPLALKRELRELAGLEKARQTEIDVAGFRLSELDQQIAGLAESLERLRTEQQTQEKDALALDHESRKLAEEVQRASSRLSVARMDLQRLDRERERSVNEQAQRQRELTASDEERTALEGSLESGRAQVNEIRAQASQAVEEHAAMRASLASLEERQRTAQSAQQRLAAQVAELDQRQRHLSAEMERMGLDRQRLLNDNIALDRRSGELAESIAAAQGAVATLTATEESQRAALSAMDESMKALRFSAQEALEKRGQFEVELVRKQSDLKHLDETCQGQLNVAVAEVAQSVEIPADEAALVEAEEKTRELSRKIEALGPVNTQALEEYEEAQRRYDFLNDQRQDLLDSIRDTERAIQEIDVESRKRFNDAFEHINANFREMFRTLFNGGLGEMRLTDESNSVDSGIDIVAQPPGKRLQNVLLLSGGERAMTAMALLMAIFKYQPSPFCILDEVDAPLDEPNIQRLTALLKEMADQTQFIVITHAKRTMEAAQAMYGVTMQEPGVSKLVSVRFQEVGKPLGAAA